MSMSQQERGELLRELQALATDADSLGNQPGREEIVETFLPLPQHELAVRPEIMVVRGERGAGKTHLFRALTQLSASKEIASVLEEAGRSQWVGGFSEAREHPQTASLDAFGPQATPPMTSGSFGSSTWSEQDDGFGDDGRAVIAELVRLGVLRERSDGRIDVPDLYRYGYDIKRQGGFRRPR